MNAAQRLHDLGQRLWLDNITRGLLTDGTLSRYIREFAVTGLTSNPTIFDQAIKRGGWYDEAIRGKAEEDLRRPNLFIKIPGTRAGIPAIEEAIFAGVPVNVTLLFSREQYLAAAEAYLRGIERRIAAGLDPGIASVASLFVSRWDVAVRDRVRGEFRNRLGIAIAMRTYKAYRDLLASERWRKLAGCGARPQRLLWASTGTQDPAVPDTLYIEALAAPDTINTVPEKTLLAFVAHGSVRSLLPVDEGYAEAVLAEFTREGVDDEALACELQRQGTEAFARSWSDLLYRIASKTKVPAKADQP